jgi:molybdopterin-dependent oxidoreductase alpha subunit
MNLENENTPSAENPENFTGLKLKLPQASAAGLEGVRQALKHVSEEAGWIRGLKALNNLNQKGGIDCPSCAWPDPDDERSGLAEYCENGAKAIADEATSKKIGADFFKENSIRELAKLSDYEIGKKGRISEPMYLAPGSDHYQPVTWEFAFDSIAAKLNSLSSPDEAVFYTSGRTSNEAAFLYQLFVRAFGTNNLPDCSNMCHESSGVALTESLGIGKGSVTLEDFYHAEVIIIMGQNPGTNHPRMMTALQKAKKNGATIISVNPLPETGLMAFSNPQELKGMLGVSEKLTDYFLQIKLNGDMPLLQAWAQMMLQDEKLAPGSAIDGAFIKDHTEGFEKYAAHILKLNRQLLADASGIEESQIEKAYQAFKNKNKIIVCWAMGLTQQKNAVDTIKEIVNFLLLKGSIGKKGAGTCPVRGHSNVQGDRTMGIYEKPGPAFLDAIEKKYHFKPPSKHGYDVVDAIRAMHDGEAKTFFAMGGNFLSATPDTLFTSAALHHCDLTVQISTKLNRSHLIHGKEAFILPCLARSDKDVYNGMERIVSCENSMGVVQSSRGTLKPVSDMLISEVDIVCRLARKVLGNKYGIDWEKYAEEYDEIRNDIEEVIPGFADYNLRVRNPGGFYLPNCNREGKFNTPGGKAIFNIGSFSSQTLAENELMMMTIRSHDQFNTTIYGLDDRYRGIFNERRVIMMNRNDMERLSVKHLQTVDIISDKDGRSRIARKFKVVEYPIAEGCTATYFPEANVLVPIDHVAEKSNTPVSKLVIVRVIPHRED